MFGMNYLVISSQKEQDLHLCLVCINSSQSNPFCVSCGKKYTGLKKGTPTPLVALQTNYKLWWGFSS